MGGDDDSDGLLDPSETWTFEATGTATAGQYENTGTATGTDPQGLGLSATDPSHYFGVRSGIEIEKSTNGADADNAPGPLIAVGDPVTWTYVVTNPGNVPIADVAVTDDQAGVDPAFQGGDDRRRRRCSTPRRPGPMRPPGPRPRANTRTSAPPPAPTRSAPGSPTPTPRTTSGPPRRSTSRSRPTAPTPTTRRGRSSRSPTKTATRPWSPGPIGSPTPATPDLTGLEVTDDHAGVTVSCPVDSLAPGRSTTCTATADAERGQYANLGTATATDPLGTEVTDTDPSHYRGVVPGIDVEKSTNGADADNAPGPRSRSATRSSGAMSSPTPVTIRSPTWSSPTTRASRSAARRPPSRPTPR